jgi:putative heme-binding domain-containing protein
VEGLSKPGGAAVAALKEYLGSSERSQKDRERLCSEIAKGKGSADNGKAVFRRICIACHKVNGEGIDYGPDMMGVGTRLKKNVIVESILDPNAKVDPKFTTTNVETKSGEAYTGFITEETPEMLKLKVAGGVTQELKIADLTKRETLKQSSMPEGLAAGMSPAEFVDLVEFLASLRSDAK